MSLKSLIGVDWMTRPSPGRLIMLSVLRRKVPMIQLKRAYEKASSTDGERVLVERLWPRGLSRERAAVDLWLKEVAPSPELRKWFGHDPARWKEFERRYWKELQRQKESVDLLRRKARHGTVTLVYAARDQEHNGALALKQFLARGKH
jgi:uncharacterized protein YeaO (DUF488 family)